MREKRNFAERTRFLKTDEAKKKYFLVYEGECSEDCYFKAVESLRKEIGINPLIELVPIIRSYSETGWSNPIKIVERICKNIDESKSGSISYETLLNWIMEYFQEEELFIDNRNLEKYFWATLITVVQDVIHTELQDIVPDLPNSCKRILDLLKEKTGLHTLVTDIDQIISKCNITYAPEYDKICFVVDRDKDSFTEVQYDNVLKTCKKRNFYFYLSNPCFEFWLLMHFDDVDKLDNMKLLDNPFVTKRYRYTEHELKRLIRGYKKSRYNAIELVGRIDIAIANEKSYCEDIVKLKNEVGSNVGLLVTELRR